jgi:hypothetical protein
MPLVWGWRGGRADQGHRAVALQQAEKRVQIMRRGDSVENEIEALGVRRHFACVTQNDGFIRGMSE